jgi:hypothetical protein
VTDLREKLEEGLAGRYALERELGRGGMATVFLAHDLRHDRSVAPLRSNPRFEQLLKVK